MFFTFSQSVAAGATFNAMDGSNFEIPNTNGILKILANATATGVVVTIAAQNVQIAQEQPVTGGGVAGTLPVEFNVSPIIEPVKKGDRISVRFRNTSGAAITVNGIVDFTPRGGGKR